MNNIKLQFVIIFIIMIEQIHSSKDIIIKFTETIYILLITVFCHKRIKLLHK